MITQQLVKQVTKEQDNDRVYKLDLCSKAITRINGLKSFTKIRCLQLGFNRIRSIENLECLPDLRELHLEYNQIYALNGLESNKMLTLLNLTSNHIEKIQNIGHLIKLETLVLDNNSIEKISGLETLKDLKYLSFSGNKLSSIDSLPAFSKLQTLNAQNNKIKKISNTIFTKSTKLVVLSLANNLLEDISFVSSLSSLQSLNLSNNNIRVIQLSPLKNLEFLNVSGNKLQKLPRISIVFPELSIFLFANNQITNQFQVIQSFAEAQMLAEVDYRGNFMDTPDFAQTLYKVYGFDRINDKNYNKPGTRYINKAQQIKKQLDKQGFNQIENDQDVRKIIMSGFFNDELQQQMTGVKPQRPRSGNKNKGAQLNFQEMEKSYKQIVKNQKRLQSLRYKCMEIFEKNGIKLNLLTPKEEQIQADKQRQRQSHSQSLIESKFPTEIRNLTDKTSSINTTTDLASRNQENINKWKQLKNREKNFNIRGIVRKMSGSQRKNGIANKEGSLSKIPSNQLQRTELMKTQLNPPRWNNDPALMRTMQARPFSSKKKDN